MKNWIRKHCVRLILGFVMFAGGIGMMICFDGLTGPDSPMLQRCVYLFLFCGTALSGFFGLLMGKWGFISGYGLVLLIVLPTALPKPYNGYFAVLYFIAILAGPYLLKKKKEAKTNKAEASGNAEEFADEEPDDEEYISPDAVPDFVLAYNNLRGRHYQIIRRGGMLHFYFIGGELGGIKLGLLQNVRETLRPIGKKDFSVAIEDVRRIKVKGLSQGIFDYKVSFKAAGKSMTLMGSHTENDSFVRFWRAVNGAEVLDRTSLEEKNEQEPDAARLKKANTVKVIYGAYVLIVELLWLFINVPYELFAVLNLLAFPAGIVICSVFRNEITINETKKTSKRCSIFTPFLLSGFALLFRTLLDFNVLKWGRLFIVAAIIFVALLGVFLLVTNEWRKKKVAVAVVIFGLLFYSIGAAMELNYLLDFSEPNIEAAEIIDMRISTGSKSPDSYYIEVEKSGGEISELEIGEEYYESLSIGDSVEVYTYGGFFGISYAIVN